MALLQKILLATLRARYVAPRSRERSVASGCLPRLLLVATLLLVALASAVYLFGRALLQGY